MKHVMLRNWNLSQFGWMMVLTVITVVVTILMVLWMETRWAKVFIPVVMWVAWLAYVWIEVKDFVVLMYRVRRVEDEDCVVRWHPQKLVLGWFVVPLLQWDSIWWAGQDWCHDRELACVVVKEDNLERQKRKKTFFENPGKRVKYVKVSKYGELGENETRN